MPTPGRPGASSGNATPPPRASDAPPGGTETAGPASMTVCAGELMVDGAARRMEARAGVHVSWGSQTLSAAHGEMDLATGRLYLGGDVRWTTPGMRVTAGEVSLSREEARLQSFHLVLNPGTAHLRAERAHWRFGEAMVLEDVRFIPCWCAGGSGDETAPGGRPRPWVAFSASSAVLDDQNGSGLDRLLPAQGRVRLEDAILRLAGIPVFYLPRVAVPLSPGGYSGPLVPRVAYYQDGFDLEAPSTWRIDDRHRIWVNAGITEGRGPRLGGALNYASTRGHGRARGVYRWDSTPGRPSRRGAWSWRHDGRFSGGSGLFVDVAGVSDADYFRDFGSDFVERADHLVASRARVEWPGQRWETIVGLRRYVGTSDGVLWRAGRFPSLDIAWTGQRVPAGPGVLRLVGDASAFWQDTGEGRLLKNGLSGPFYGHLAVDAGWIARPFRIVSVRTSVGYQVDAMARLGNRVDTSAPGERLVALRQVAPAALDLRTTMVRRFEMGGRGGVVVQHDVVPAIQLYQDLWSVSGPGFEPPVGEQARGPHGLIVSLKQSVSGRRRGSAHRVELGYARMALGRELDLHGRWSDVEMSWSLWQPAPVGLFLLVSSDLRAVPWVFLNGVAGDGPLTLGYRVGWMNPDVEAHPPRPDYPSPSVGGWTVDLSGRVSLSLLGGLLPRRRLDGWHLEFRSVLGIGARLTSQVQRLELRYRSRCDCFSLSAFVAIEGDRAVPTTGGSLWPAPAPIDAWTGAP